jgi:CubicO group peptidase (beta-lactamase class C family)
MLNFHKLEQQIEATIRAVRVPGMALAVVQGQEVVYVRGFGVTSVEDSSLPITPQTLFPIGSITKPLTGTAVMRLAQSGLLDLDRPIAAYVPGLQFSRPGAAGEITLRMLLSHTAGLPSDYRPFGYRGAAGLEQYVREEVSRYPFVAPPGTLYAYSGPGVSVAGYILEAVTGKYFTEVAQELLFDPLEMKRSTWDPAVAITYPVAQAHTVGGNGRPSVLHRMPDNTAAYPRGHLLATILDLANFAVMQLNDGRFRDRQVLAPALVATMRAPQADLYTLAGTQSGLTLFTEPYKGLRLVTHSGSMASFGGQFRMLPEAGLAVIILTNRLTNRLPAAQIAHHIFDRLLDLPPDRPKPAPLALDKSACLACAGVYRGNGAEQVIVVATADQLILHWDGKEVGLVPFRPDFYAGPMPGQREPVTVGFVRSGDGSAAYAVVRAQDNQRVMICRRET